MATVLSSRSTLHDFLLDLLTFPCGTVEILTIEFRCGDEHSIGRVVSPARVTSAIVDPPSIPLYAHPGPLVIRLTLQAIIADDAEAALTIAALGFHTFVTAVLEPPESQSPRVEYVSLPVQVKPDAPSRSVIVTVDVPPDASLVGHVVSILRMSIAGQPVAGLDLPAPLCIQSAITAPLFLPLRGFGTYLMFSPAVSSRGTIFVPQTGKTCVVLSADGDLMPFIDVEGLGMSSETVSAGVCDVSNLLFLADADTNAGALVAVDQTSTVLRWRTSEAHCKGYAGVAVLSNFGVLISASIGENVLHAFRISDGALLATIPSDVRDSPSSVASHSATGFVYVAYPKSIVQYRWDGSTLTPLGLVSAASRERGEKRGISVMPARDSHSCAHLLIGTWGGGHLDVLSIPDHRIVFSGRFTYVSACGSRQNINFRGLSADPNGAVMLVCDRYSNLLLCLPWSVDDLSRPETASSDEDH
jgi:hypothetical protein